MVCVAKVGGTHSSDSPYIYFFKEKSERIFSNYRVCVDFSGSFYFFLILCTVPTEGVHVSWTSTDVRKY